MTKKVKRTISVIIAAIMLLSTMSALAFAADLPTYPEITSKEVGPHDHVAAIASKNVVVPETKFVVCYAGEKLMAEDIKAFAQPTCVKPGCREYFMVCAICGKEIPGTRLKLELPKLASHHQAGPVVIEDVKQPTCGDFGSYWEVVRCVLCNKVLSRNLVSVTPTTNHVPDIPVKEHIINATCAQTGQYDSVIYCKVCGRELQRTYKQIPKTDIHVSEYSLNRFVFQYPGDPSKVKVIFVKKVPAATATMISGITENANGTLTFTGTNGTAFVVDPNKDYPYIDDDNYKTLVSPEEWNQVNQNAIIIKTDYLADQGVPDVDDMTITPDIDDITDKLVDGINETLRSNLILVPDPTEAGVWYGPYMEVSTYLTKSDSGVALGYFPANRFAANGGRTRTCADGEERCAICGELLQPQIPHVWDGGTVTVPATLTTQGEILYRCLIKGCGASYTINSAVNPPRKGDVNVDGAVTPADARFILRYAVGLGSYDKIITSKTFDAADMDNNKEIEPADARLALRTAVGLRNP